MSRCRESRLVQEYLDAELEGARVRTFEAHLETCEACAAELAAYRRMFGELDHVLGGGAIEDPGPALTERILDRVLPSRLRRRWITAIGWLYGVSSAIATFAAGSWLAQPSTPERLARTYGEISLRAMQSVLFVFQLVTRSCFDLLQGWDILARLGALFTPLARALARPLADPTLGIVTAAAMLVTISVLWWMRPRRGEAREGARHVSVLGF
jgi:Putative zinc-finger